jgi:hypothetical protein
MPSGPRALLRLEGLVVFALALAGYAWLRASWPLFALLVLAPDLTMLGYLAGPRVGALAYDAAHTYVGPALLGAAALATGSVTGQAVALVWAAHLGADRALGFGLKYGSGFRDTHLQRV